MAMQGVCQDRAGVARPQRRVRSLAVDHPNEHAPQGGAAAHTEPVQFPTYYYRADSPMRRAELLVESDV